MKKQFLAKLLVLAMVLTMVPAVILAASATAGNDPTANKEYDYSYSVAADTALSELPEDGVIVAKPVGGVSNVVLSKDLVASIPVEDGVKVIKLDTTGAEKVSVTIDVAGLAVEDGEDGDVHGVTIECTQAIITIPGDQLTKAVAKAEAEFVAIVITPVPADAAEGTLPGCTVYLDWVATKIPGMTKTAR